MLRRMAQATYGERDPSSIFYEGSPQEIEKDPEGGYTHKMRMPFTDKTNLKLARAGDELAISVGNFRRNLVLPRALASLQVQKARFDANDLLLKFGNGADEPTTKKRASAW